MTGHKLNSSISSLLFHFAVFGGTVPFKRGWPKVGRVRTGAAVNPVLARENFFDGLRVSQENVTFSVSREQFGPHFGTRFRAPRHLLLKAQQSLDMYLSFESPPQAKKILSRDLVNANMPLAALASCITCINVASTTLHAQPSKASRVLLMLLSIVPAARRRRRKF